VNADALNTLLRLQELDLTLLQLKKEAKGIPARREAIISRSAGAKDALAAAKAALRAREAEIKSVEGAVEAIQERIKRYQVQEMEVKSNEAYRALEEEIASSRKEISAEEDRELALMDTLEPLQAAVAKAEKDLAAAEEAVRSDAARLDERMETVRAEFEEVKQSREPLIARLDPDLVKRYLAHLSAKEDAYLVPAKQQTCGGCHMKLSPQTLHDLHAAVKWTACTFCGRLLYDPVR
jgi:predicted  nucleic acid-binding Zn-ribbon protein